LSGQQATIPAGSKLGVRVRAVSGTSTAMATYWGSTADTAGTGTSGVLTVTEVEDDIDYTDGTRYTKTLAISYAGDGILPYRFFANDGTNNATGDPTSDSNLTITNASVLNWTGETNFESDGVNPGVNPNTSPSGTTFQFRVKFTDATNTAPTSIQAWVDLDDDEVYDVGEKFGMTETYTDGKLYYHDQVVSTVGDDDIIDYRFYATNANGDSIGDPTSSNTFVLNNAPTLAWTGETNYSFDGADPDQAPSGSTFTFRVDYTDADNDAPTSMQVWIDADDSGTYEAGEKHDMTATDGGDTTYTDGKRYTYDKALSSAGDDTLSYLFYATDGTDAATGDPVTGGSVSITETLTVPGQYGTIQAAINVSSTGDTILVSDGTYSENIDFIGKNVTVISVNGSGSTTIQGESGNNDAVVSFENGEGSGAVLDGFTIDNQAANSLTRGIYISGAAPTIQNSIIENNSADGNNGGGVYIDNGAPSFDNVTIRSNSAANRSGCGMYIMGAAGGVTITNSTIGGSGTPNTCPNGTGGGIYYTGATTGTLSISDSTISYNQGEANAGGIYINNVDTTTNITNTTITNNYTGSSGYGGGIYATDAPISITGGSVSDNTAGVNRGGGGIFLGGGSTVNTITGTTINSNTAGSFGGGGIYLTGTGTALNISKCNIRGNEVVTDGGGIYLAAGTSATITSCTITGNLTTDAFNGDGGGVYDGGTATIYSSTIAGNYGGENGGGLRANGTTIVDNSIIWGNDAPLTGPQISGTPS
ncbi:MAG: right-handed parallel beta-helix repeat-containing protein, partial [Planctomycetota bacterium]